MQAGNGLKNLVLWFRNDLRLHDNPLLHLGASLKPERIVALYFCDERFENEKQGKFRLEAAAELKRVLKSKLGIRLLCFSKGHRPEDTIPLLAECTVGKGGAVACSDESGPYEQSVQRKLNERLSKQGWELKTCWNYTMYHPDDLPFSPESLPEPFTAMRNKVEGAQTPIRAPVPIPSKSMLSRPALLIKQCGTDAPVTLDKCADKVLRGLVDPTEALAEMSEPHHDSVPNSASEPHHGFLQFVGGEKAATERLEAFCADGLSTYKKKRNGSIGWSYSTKLSPWLAVGCISPRQIHHRIRVYEEEHGETVDTYWVSFELLWRDYMRFFLLKQGSKLFHQYGPAARPPPGVTWAKPRDAAALYKFDAWRLGRTGVPWVDGHMRELLATGFMSNRGRQNVASFLVFDLGVDWRMGASHFEESLIDHDVSANWANWAFAAGVGSRSMRVNRFNMHKQAMDYDPAGEHARLWIPELRGVSPDQVHKMACRPPTSNDASVRDEEYPRPLVLLKHAGAQGGRSGGSYKKSNKPRAHRGRKKVFNTT